MKSIALATSVTTVAAMSIAISVASASPLLTRCTGTAGAVTVPNDLVVPRGSACELLGTTVQGNVRVAADADFVLDGARIEGTITMRDDALLDATDSSVHAIEARRSFGAFLQGSDVAGAVGARGGAFLYSVESTHTGDISVTDGESYLETVRLTGALTVRRGSYADVYDSTVTGAVQVEGTELGSVVCTSEVDGTATFEGNGDIIDLGADLASEGCEFNVFGSDVELFDNTAEIRIVGNVVRGDLVCEGNDPAPTGSDNRIRGEAIGQCADLAPAAEAEGLGAEGLRGTGTDRGDLLRDKVEQRRATTDEELVELGQADLG